jgi:hypothetical protein
MAQCASTGTREGKPQNKSRFILRLELPVPVLSKPFESCQSWVPRHSCAGDGGLILSKSSFLARLNRVRSPIPNAKQWGRWRPSPVEASSLLYCLHWTQRHGEYKRCFLVKTACHMFPLSAMSFELSCYDLSSALKSIIKI